MEAGQSAGGLTWLSYALMTVVAWGIYGVFLHTGQSGMGDPVNGRYKAFLFVGIAYFITAVLAPLALLTSGHPSTQQRKVERLDIAERFVERVMTVAHTLRKRGRDVLDFFERTVAAHFTGVPVPRLAA